MCTEGCPEVMGTPGIYTGKRKSTLQGCGNGVQCEIGLQQVDLKHGGGGLDMQEQARGEREVLGR